MGRLKAMMSVVVSISFFCTHLFIPSSSSYAISPSSLLSAEIKQTKALDDKIWAKINEAKLLLHALLLYDLQINQGLSGEELKTRFSFYFAAQGKGVISKEIELVSRFDWDNFELGYFPFKLNGQELAISIFKKGERPDTSLAKILAEGEFEKGPQFIVLHPFDESDFLKRVLDPNFPQSQISSDFQWLLDNPNDQKKVIAQRAFDLIQSLSYMRTAHIYQELNESARQELLNILGAQSIGRMLFGLMISNRDEAVKKIRQEAKRAAGRLQRRAHALKKEAAQIRDSLSDEEISGKLMIELAASKKELEENLRSLSTLVALVDDELLHELQRSGVLKMRAQAESIIAEITQADYLEKSLKRKLHELGAEIRAGPPKQFSLEELAREIKAGFEEKKKEAEELLKKAKILEDFKTFEDVEALKALTDPYRKELARERFQVRTTLTGINRRLNSLRSGEGTEHEIKSFRLHETKRARELEAEAEGLQTQGKKVAETVPDDMSMIQAAATKMQSALGFVERVLTQQADFASDGVSQTGKRDSTAYEKYKQIAKVMDAALQFYLMEQNGFVRDMTLRAARREVDQLIGVEEAVQFGVLKLLERGKPRFLFLNTTEYQRADAVSGLAIRLLQDSKLPVSLRAKKIMKLDFKEFPGEVPDFLSVLHSVFVHAQAMGNVILVVDFNQVLAQFHHDKEAMSTVLNAVLASVKGFNVPVIGWISPDNKSIFQPAEKFSALFQNAAVRVELKASHFEQVLKTELVDIERHNKVKFPPETVDKVLLAIFADTRVLLQFSDLWEFVRVLKGIASKAELDGLQNIPLASVESAIQEFMNGRKKVETKRKGGTQGEVDYEVELRNRELPEEVVEVVERESTRLKQLPKGSPEAGYIRNYLDWLVSLPWDHSSSEVRDIENVARILEEDHYGLERAKAQVIEHVGVFIRTGKSKGGILLLHGPPGVGKTSIGKSIARALGRQFVRFSVGGMRDEAEIRGHRRTYVGAMPGRIIKVLRDAGTNNPVMMIDEVDKIGHDYRGDPADAFLEVLDPEQNSSFRDHYLEVGFDLSKVLFILNANDVSKIPGPLKDRMFAIELEGYTVEEKVKIAKQFLIPRVLKDHEMTENEFSLTGDDVVRFVVEEYTREAGVRQLERLITQLIRRANLEMLKNKVQQVVVDRRKAEAFLGTPEIEKQRKLDEDEVGVVAGLAWSPSGGSVLFCESAIYPLEGKPSGPLSTKLTGSLQDVMKESASVALTVVRRAYLDLGINPEELGGQELHIHFPAGATPKDGPSAGVTITTALVSLLTGLPVDSTVAMTGEISLRKDGVLPIGGLKQKILAAYSAGMKTIIIPKENEKDLKDIPEEILKHLKIVLVRRVEEVWEAAIPGLKERMEKIHSEKAKGEGKTKIRRGDPDLTKSESDKLKERLIFVPYRVMALSSTDSSMYQEMLRQLARTDDAPLSNLHRELDQRFVIRIVEGGMRKRLDFGVPGKKVYAFTDGNIIYVTAKLVDRFRKFPWLFAALMRHELFESFGQSHEKAEESEFAFGQLGGSLSSLDLALAAFDRLEEGVLMEPEEFLERFEFIGKVRHLKAAQKLLENIFREPLKQRRLEELVRGIMDYYAGTSIEGPINIRTGVYVVERGSRVNQAPFGVEVLTDEMPLEILGYLRGLDALGIHLISLDHHALEAYRRGDKGIVIDSGPTAIFDCAA